MSLAKRLIEQLPAREVARRKRAEFLKATGRSSQQIGRILGSEFRRAPSTRSRTQSLGVSARTGVYVTGFKELDKKFAAMPESMQKKALRPACRAVAKLVLQLTLAVVPRLTGALAKSLKVRAAKRSKAKSRQNQVAVQVRTIDGLFRGDQFYGGILEFGTKEPRRTKTGANRGEIKEYRFLRDSLYSFPDRKRRIFQRAVRDWMRKEAAKKVIAS